MKSTSFSARMRSFARAFSVVCCLLLFSFGVHAQAPASGQIVFDFDADFSPTTNPNGSWSYGWKTNIGGAFVLLTNTAVVPFNNGNMNLWWLNPPGFPVFYHNGTSQTTSASGGTYPPGTTFMLAGVDGSIEKFVAVRFTVPPAAAGLCSVTSSVLPYLNGTGAGDTDFHVVWNGQEIFGQFLASGAGTNYSANLNLQPGDTLDFLCGRGADGDLSGSGLKFDATITSLAAEQNLSAL